MMISRRLVSTIALTLTLCLAVLWPKSVHTAPRRNVGINEGLGCTLLASDYLLLEYPYGPLSRRLCPPSADISECDAEFLAMEISGRLLPPEDLYVRIRDDLTAIRAAYPGMNSISHSPRWVPGDLLVILTPEAWEQYQNGDYHGLDHLNAPLGPVEITSLRARILLLRFTRRYNPEALTTLYADADGVESAEPNGIIGQPTSDVQASIPEYTFLLWWDCFEVCLYHHYWVFSVINGDVTLVEEGGDPPEHGQDFKVYLPTVLQN
jgi:hypothetical protein